MPPVRSAFAQYKTFLEAEFRTWRRHARCAGADTGTFYPDDQAGARRVAEEICHRCPVRMACLEYAVVMEEPVAQSVPTMTRAGVWGGMTPRERKALMVHIRHTDPAWYTGRHHLLPLLAQVLGTARQATG